MTTTGNLFRLDGKVALITGGYGGIGSVLTRGLAEMGAGVAIAGHNQDKATGLAEQLKSLGHSTFASKFDVTSGAETERMVDEVAAHFGRLDILVNTIGLQREESAGEITQDNFDHVLNVNLRGAMFQSQVAAQHMIQQGTGGKMVHFGSVRSSLALRGRGFAAYCAAKGGLSIMCKQLAAEWAQHKINVNVVAPTFVRTEQVAGWLSDPVFYSKLIERIPLARVAEPEDILGAVIYFASSASDFVTGQTLYLDGGVTATQ